MMVLRRTNIMSVNAPIGFFTGSCLILHKQVGKGRRAQPRVLWNGTVSVSEDQVSHMTRLLASSAL